MKNITRKQSILKMLWENTRWVFYLLFVAVGTFFPLLVCDVLVLFINGGQKFDDLYGIKLWFYKWFDGSMSLIIAAGVLIIILFAPVYIIKFLITINRASYIPLTEKELSDCGFVYPDQYFKFVVRNTSFKCYLLPCFAENPLARIGADVEKQLGKMVLSLLESSNVSKSEQKAAFQKFLDDKLEDSYYFRYCFIKDPVNWLCKTILTVWEKNESIEYAGKADIYRYYGKKYVVLTQNKLYVEKEYSEDITKSLSENLKQGLKKGMAIKFENNTIKLVENDKRGYLK